MVANGPLRVITLAVTLVQATPSDREPSSVFSKLAIGKFPKGLAAGKGNIT